MSSKIGHSSDILLQLYGDITPLKKILSPYEKQLKQLYPNKNITPLFNLTEKIIVIGPMMLCKSLLLDLGVNVKDQYLVALGLHMLLISTHDDVVDETPENRINLAALVYAGNIASNLGASLLIKQEDLKAAQVLYETINLNHYFQQKIVESLWIDKPKDFEEYKKGIHHVVTFAAIGLIYGLALAKKQNLRKKIWRFAEGYGIALQIIDDIREVEEDKINGYWSYPIIEGSPYQESKKKLYQHIVIAKVSIPNEWKNLLKLVDNLEVFAKNMYEE